jgi:hypothetical protein
MAWLHAAFEKDILHNIDPDIVLDDIASRNIRKSRGIIILFEVIIIVILLFFLFHLFIVVSLSFI